MNRGERNGAGRNESNGNQVIFTEDNGSRNISCPWTCHADKPKKQTQKAKEILRKCKALEVEIKQHRRRRSLDANAYLWVLLSKMADVLHTTKRVIPGNVTATRVFTHIVVKPEIVDRVKQEWRTVRVLGEVTVNGKTGVQLQCYFGSSTYNSKEMSVLIDGVISECKDLGIETMPPDELALLKSKWGKA